MAGIAAISRVCVRASAEAAWLPAYLSQQSTPLFACAGLLCSTAAAQEVQLPAEGAQSPVVFLPEFKGLAVPAHAEAIAWLWDYFTTRYGAWGDAWNRTESSPLPSLLPCGASGRRPLAMLPQRRSKYLVLSAVGDTWQPRP
jgi:hypothetical protein